MKFKLTPFARAAFTRAVSTGELPDAEICRNARSAVEGLVVNPDVAHDGVPPLTAEGPGGKAAEASGKSVATEVSTDIIPDSADADRTRIQSISLISAPTPNNDTAVCAIVLTARILSLLTWN